MHIDIKCFFVKDKVDKYEIQIKYCPIDFMLSDYVMKPLQGSLFRRLRDIIMGYMRINDNLMDYQFSLKYHFEKYEIVT